MSLQFCRLTFLAVLVLLPGTGFAQQAKTPAAKPGRKLAFVSPDLRQAKRKGLNSSGASACGAGNRVPGSKQQNLRTFSRVPFNVQETADTCCHVARQSVHFLADSVNWAVKWLSCLERQMTAPPLLTPLGSPYVTLSARHLRLMPDGRLKTVVKQ